MEKNYIRLLRHATLLIQLGDLKILVDPMLSAKDEMDPVQNCENNFRIPMVDLPIGKTALKEVLNEIDAVVITHLHRDHWDLAAQTVLEKNKLVFCQPADTEKIKAAGFLNVTPIENNLTWKGINISRTKGKHGTGEIGKKMGEVSGFIFSQKELSIYVAGDTIWCDDVENALTSYKPNHIVLNAGAAQFLSGDPITMTPADIVRVHEFHPDAKLIAVHMDTVNHCLVKRKDLKKKLEENNLTSKVMIPLDGEIVYL